MALLIYGPRGKPSPPNGIHSFLGWFWIAGPIALLGSMTFSPLVRELTTVGVLLMVSGTCIRMAFVHPQWWYRWTFLILGFVIGFMSSAVHWDQIF